MSEHAPEPVDFDSEIDSWIAGGTVTKRSVEIYLDKAVHAEIDALLREHDLLERELSQVGGDESLSDPRLADLNARLEKLRDRREASKTTWIVRALTEDDFSEVRGQLPDAPEFPDAPEVPAALPEDATDADRAEHERAMAAVRASQAEWEQYEQDSSEWTAQFNMVSVAKAVDEVRHANGKVAQGVTVKTLEGLRAKFGSKPLTRLMEAAAAASMEEPEIPGPFSVGRSRGAATSSSD